MSQRPINLSPDLQRLRADGYNIQIRSGYLLMKDVPYVNNQKVVRRGTLVSKLDLAGDVTTRPSDHQVQFAGDHPCHLDGSLMEELVNNKTENRLYDDLFTQYSFSHKPPEGYADYYQKMSTYAAILTTQAEALEPGATALTHLVEEPPPEEDSPFNYMDTASSRADINVVTKKLALHKVAIVGLGGTGSYILDLVAKTPVKEIHLYDKDIYATHNAFRAPGAPSLDELRAMPQKTAYFAAIYSKMHRGIKGHDAYMDASQVEALKVMDFVFLCMDRGKLKRLIIQKLEEYGITFIDVGMGIYIKNERLGGIIKVTASTKEHRKHVHENSRISLDGDDDENEYNKNIQIADLNALNAALAVIKWKKLFGFYGDYEKELSSTYTIDCNMLTGDDAS